MDSIQNTNSFMNDVGNSLNKTYENKQQKY